MALASDELREAAEHELLAAVFRGATSTEVDKLRFEAIERTSAKLDARIAIANYDMRSMGFKGK